MTVGYTFIDVGMSLGVDKGSRGHIVYVVSMSMLEMQICCQSRVTCK